MAEELIIAQGTKVEKYRSLLPQIKALVEGEENMIANMANIAACLKATFDFLWVGFYIVEKEQLVLGPFQGPVACTRIAKGKGVCGTAWSKNEVLIVPDVEQFEGHIACSSASRSEIVLPITKDIEVIAVLDVDSEDLAAFDETDAEYLYEICSCLSA